jgi:hypothetical protein
VATEFASSGADKVVRDEERVEKAISRTARTAERSEGKTRQWMERHKGALTAIGVAAGGAMAAIISQTPELVAGLSETQLYFSMFAMELGQTWSPALEGFNGLLEAALGWFEKLPDPVKDLVGGLTGIGLALLVAIPAIALFVWSLSTIGAAAAGLSFTTALGGLTLLGAAVGIVAGLLIGGVVVWALWRTGVLQAIEEAGAKVGQFAYNAGVVFGNLKDNILKWLGLVAASAGLWGAQFALNWIDGIVSNIPFLGDLLGPQIDSLKGVLDQAGIDLQKQWDEWNASGGFKDGLTVGVVTPSWANDPSKMQHPVTDWMNSLFGGAPGAGDTAGQADRLKQILPDFEMPAGYDDALTQLQEIQTQSETLDRTASTTAANVSASMATMASNTSTSSQSVSTTTGGAAGDVATTFDSLVSRSPKWGSDLMGHFVAGVNMQFPALLSTLARVRSAIESALSFDIVSNDRTAQRWGSDFVQHFNAGLASRPIELPEIPVPSVPEITIPVSAAAAAVPEMPTIPAEPRMIDTILGTLPDLPDLPRLSATIDMILGAVPEIPEFDAPRTSVIDMILGAVPEMPRLSATVDAVFSAMPDPMLRQAAPAGMSAPVAPAPVIPPAPVSGAGASTSTTYNTPVTVEINITGAQAQNLDERKIAALVRDEIAGALRSRGR